MRVIVDECLAESTKKILRKNKFIVLEIDEILKLGITDEEIYDYATEILLRWLHMIEDSEKYIITRKKNLH